jgi:hypothetical protein
VRDLVRREHGDPRWTDIQAEVYGPLYRQCPPCIGAIEAIYAIAQSQHVSQVVIISHKTLADSAGKNYKLRDFALCWLDDHLLGGRTPLTRAQVIFTSTMEEKRQVIVEKNCHFFLDDLPEIIEPLRGKIPHPVLFKKDADRLPQTCDWVSFKALVCHG